MHQIQTSALTRAIWIADGAGMTPTGDPSDKTMEVGSVRGNERPRLLYIEDNLSNLTLVEWILNRETDIELVSAMRGRLGLELAREHHPALIVLDLHLPDLSGEAVLQCLKADDATRQIPVVVLSADTSAKRIARVLQMGARNYLTKPLDIQRFLEVVVAGLQTEMVVRTVASDAAASST